MVRTISTPRWPLVATVRSAALITFFEDARVCLGGAVVAESVIMMGRGKNKEALKEEMPPRVHVVFMIGSKSFAFFRLRPNVTPTRRSSLHCTSGVKRPRPTNHVGHLNKRWEENLACEGWRKTYEHRKMFSALSDDQGALSEQSAESLHLQAKGHCDSTDVPSSSVLVQCLR